MESSHCEVEPHRVNTRSDGSGLDTQDRARQAHPGGSTRELARRSSRPRGRSRTHGRPVRRASPGSAAAATGRNPAAARDPRLWATTQRGTGARLLERPPVERERGASPPARRPTAPPSARRAGTRSDRRRARSASARSTRACRAWGSPRRSPPGIPAAAPTRRSPSGSSAPPTNRHARHAPAPSVTVTSSPSRRRRTREVVLVALGSAPGRRRRRPRRGPPTPQHLVDPPAAGTAHENADLIFENRPPASPTTSPRPSANCRSNSASSVDSFGRHLDLHDGAQIAATATVQARHASPTQDELVPRLRARRDDQVLVTVERRERELGAERRLRDRDRHLDHQVVLLPAEAIVGCTRRCTYRSPAGHRAGRPRRAGQAQRRPVDHTGRHVDGVGLVGRDPALAAARGARRGDHLADATAARARAGGHHLAEHALAHAAHLTPTRRSRRT
jgi:hypothetical protein